MKTPIITKRPRPNRPDTLPRRKTAEEMHRDPRNPYKVRPAPGFGGPCGYRVTDRHGNPVCEIGPAIETDTENQAYRIAYKLWLGDRYLTEGSRR